MNRKTLSFCKQKFMSTSLFVLNKLIITFTNLNETKLVSEFVAEFVSELVSEFVSEFVSKKYS